MKKKVLSILLALCLVLTLLPSTALASVSCALYVGNTLVYAYASGITNTYVSGTTYYWKAAGSGDDIYVDTGSEDDYLFSVSFDEDSYSFTLTLNGVNISSLIQYDDDPLSYAYGIRAIGYLDIVLADGTENSVDISSSTATDSYGIFCCDNITISGGGSLSVSGGEYGIYDDNSSTIGITSGSVTASGNIQALYCGSTSVSMTSYKYRTNTAAPSAPDTGYTLYSGTAFSNSNDYKYVEIIPCPKVYVSGDNADSGTVKVSGVADEGNTSYWLNDGSGSITSTGASAESYNVKYDEATQTLTLKDATITSYYSDYMEEHQYGIYAQSDLNIVLEGSNSIGTTGTPVGTTGIQCGGDLSLSAASGGSLSIVSDEYGIDADDSVSIDGGTVSISAGRLGVTAGEGGFFLIDGEVSVTSEKTGINAEGDVAITGAQTVLNVTACTATDSVGYGIVSLNSILITDAAVSITKNGNRGDAVRARYDIRISGGADISIVDWSTSDGGDCGMHSGNGSVAIGGSSQVDICSQRIGIYARESVYLGYVWNGSAYAVSGSPTVNLNDSVNVAAITPGTPDDFVIGGNGIKTSNGGISMSDGTLTAVGSEKALFSSTIDLPSFYKYRKNISQSAPETLYTLSTDAQFENSDDSYKYVELLTAYNVSKETAPNGSFTASADGTEAECAAAGDTVTLTAAPASGYVFSSWSVYRTGNPGTAVSVSGNSFTMPAYPVTVTATFAVTGGSGDYTPSRTIIVTETSSPLFSNAQGAVKAKANMTNAFSSSVEVKVTDTDESASGFGLGAGNTVYPFDISLYIKGTNTKTEPQNGYAVTISLPVPDELLDVKEQLSVVHESDDRSVTTLASQLKQISGVWYLVFEATEFSPYALVVNSKVAYDETAGLPYYVDSNRNEVFIGFAANGTYLAPSGVTVLFKGNVKAFTDIGSHWANDYIGFVTEREIFLGTASDTFSPDSGMTRAMFATVVGRLYERSYGEIETMSTHAFTDCSYDDYYGKYVDWAAENGILGGYGDGNFDPDDPVTREQMAAILYRFADFLGVLPNDMDTAPSFPDAGSISSYAESAALYCQSTGIITGRDGGSFVPQGTATRAEVATIIQRFVESVMASLDNDFD